MPRLLHIITGLSTGGAERSLYSLLAGGLADHAENHVISLSGNGEFGARIARLGVPVHALGLKGGRNPVAALTELRRLVREVSPEVIQGWMYHGNLAARFARSMAPSKPRLAWNIRQTLYNLSAEKRGTQLVIRAGKWLSKSPDAVLYNSEVARQHHETFGYSSGNGQVIPNGFNTSLWRPDLAMRAQTRTILGLDEDAIVIGFVARFHPMKDLGSLLQAVAPLMVDNPHVHLVIVGRGNEPDNPTLAPFYLGLPSARVHILGQREDIPSLMPSFDIFCLSSNSEAFPNVLGEAMACGVSCVTTDVGDSHLVVGDTGRVVPPSEPEALREGLAAMITLSPGERSALGDLARSRIQQNFSLSATVRRYTSLYDSILKGH